MDGLTKAGHEQVVKVAAADAHEGWQKANAEADPIGDGLAGQIAAKRPADPVKQHLDCDDGRHRGEDQTQDVPWDAADE